MEEAVLRDLASKRVGTVLCGKYTVDRILGVGGMAVVYAATHRNQKQVAIKMLHPHVSIYPELVKRFLREGYVANSVKHKGAVDVIDDETTEDGLAFLVMEYLEGAPLDVIAERHGNRLAPAAALAVGHELCHVLEAAHRREIVHRDIKPANVFVTTNGDVKVLDFGIARLRDPSSAQSTSTGVMLGTPAYMAPEQALGNMQDIGPATDIWAVGSMLFFLLSGELVHPADNAQTLLIQLATKPPRSLAAAAPALPREIVEIVDRALQFDHKARWVSAGAMRTAIEQAYRRAAGDARIGDTLSALAANHRASERPVSGLALTMPHTPAAAPAPAPASSAPSPAVAAVGQTTGMPVSRSSFVEPIASRGSVMAVAAVAIAAMLAGGGYLVHRLTSTPAPASTALVPPPVTDRSSSSTSAAASPPPPEPVPSPPVPNASTLATTTTTTTATAAPIARPIAIGAVKRPDPKPSATPAAPAASASPPPTATVKPDPGSIR